MTLYIGPRMDDQMKKLIKEISPLGYIYSVKWHLWLTDGTGGGW